MTSDLSTNASASEPAAPPADSQITIDRFADGLTIQIPPAGIRGTKGLFFMAIFWNGAMVFFSAIFLGGGEIALIGILSLFWLVGIGLLLGALNMARRRAAFAVTGGTLMVLQTGLFSAKQRDFEPGDVEAVRVGRSGMTVNDEPVLELQIIDGGGHQTGILAGRSNDELYWLAAELSQALKRSAKNPTS
jgi:hypothetical protein